ncbi:MAG: extracellular solute-binding protein [Hydrogeniiclostridium sp.]
MSKRKRLAALLLALAVSLPASACSGGENVSSAGNSSAGGENASGLTEPGSFPISEEPVTLTVLTQQIPSIIDITTNDFTLWYEELTNIHIEWQLVPSDSVESNLNLALSGGDYPDIFLSMGIKSSQEDQYGGEGKIFRPLNTYIDSCMPNFKSVLEEKPDVLSDITAMDGSIYSLPSITEYLHGQYAQKMWVNTQWLDTLGLKKPETTEDFYQMLKAFKKEDPNGNGIADEIPLSGVIDTGGGWYSDVSDFILNAFVYDSGATNDALRRYVNMKTGDIEIAVNQESYREGLRYMHKLYSEGLIDPAAFTNTNDQLKQIALNPGVEILGAAPAGHPAMFMDITTDPERYAMFDAIAPLEGPEGVRQAPKLKEDREFGEAAISTSCSNPEAAARWLDGFYDYDIQMERAWGAEGEAWRDAEEGELGLDGEPALYKTLIAFDESAQNQNWAWLGIEYTPMELFNGQTVTPKNVDLYSAEGFERRMMSVTEELYQPYDVSDTYQNMPNVLRYSETDAEERNLLHQDLQTLAKEYRVYFITGEKSLDDDWEEYIQALQNMQLDRFLELENAAYDAYIEKTAG